MADHGFLLHHAVHLVLGGLLEVERGAVDAVSEAGGLGPVLEHVAEVGPAQFARHLGADQTGVRDDAEEVAPNSRSVFS